MDTPTFEQIMAYRDRVTGITGDDSSFDCLSVSASIRKRILAEISDLQDEL